jgi:transcriptional regulator with XRE-family HTH domain
MPPPNPTGRPPVAVDAEKVELMAAMGCTVEEIAAELRISKRTLMRRQKDPKFLESIERGKARGRATLRRLQWKSANAGNVTAQIWLGKQLLGQRDQWAVDHSGAIAHKAVLPEWLLKQLKPAGDMSLSPVNEDSTPT